MNPLLLLTALNAQRHIRMLEFLYCRSAFSSLRALASHVRTHHPTKIRERRNLYRPYVVLAFLIFLASILVSFLQPNLRIGNTLSFLYGDNISAGINWSFLSCPLEPGMFSVGNFGNADPSLIVPPNHSVVSDGDQVHPCNHIFSASTVAPVDGGSSNTFASPAATGFFSISVGCHDHDGYPNPVADTHSAPNLKMKMIYLKRKVRKVISLGRKKLSVLKGVGLSRLVSLKMVT